MSNQSGIAAERVSKLLDANSFVELQSRVTARSTDFNLSAKKAPSDGVVIGHGLINDQLVFVFSQDASVLGGSIGEMHAKKIVSVYDMALKVGAPVIGLLDCSGIRLQESFDALEAMGTILAKATDATGLIPQIMCVCGNCGGGLSVLASLADFTYMVDGASLFVNSPDAIEGNSKSACDTSSAEFQMKETGVVDFAGDEATVFDAIRKLVTILPASDQEIALDDCEDDVNRAAEGIEGMVDDGAKIATEISDNRVFIETKQGYASCVVTGFIKLDGMTVGVIGKRPNKKGKMSICPKGASKMADFVEFCDNFSIPVLTITNVDSLANSMKAETMFPRALRDMTRMFASSYTPKINLIVGNAIGSAYVLMNSKALGADLVYALPTAKVGVMDAKLAAKVITEDGEDSAKVAAEFDALQNSVEAAAARGYIDRIVEPADVRKYVIDGFDMLLGKIG